MVLNSQRRVNIVAVFDYEKWMGITGNVLDYSYDSHSNFPDVLQQFATACVAATQIDSTSCAFALSSMKAADPVKDVVERVNDILRIFAPTCLITLPDMAGPLHTAI